MRRWISIAFLLGNTALWSRPADADCNDPFGKPNEVLDFHIRMKRTDWRSLLASTVRSFDGLPLDSPACMDEFPEFAAEFRCGAEGAWLPVGLRKKRGTERGVEAPEKPPLKIDFNEDFMGKQPAAKGQRWPASMGELGYRKLSLNNGQSNKPADRTLLLPVLLQEHVALRLLKREIPATPGVAYAKVTLYFEDRPAGEYHGVYIVIEDLDRTAVRRRWGQADGKLIKQSKSNCSPEVEYDDGPPNAASDAFAAWVKKNPASYPGTWLAESEKGVDVDALLRQEAIREIILNGDDTLAYAGVRSQQGNNWFAFEPRVGVRQFMPWDVDLTFGQQSGNCMPTPLKCAPNIPLLRHCATTMSTVGKLTVCNPEIQKRYLAIMCQLTQGSLSAAEILKVWEQAYATVAPVVPLEKDFIWGGMNPASPAIDKSFGAEYVRLKAWIPERVKSVQQQLTMRGVACSGGCQAGAKESCRHLNCPGERRCDNGAWTSCQPTAGCRPGPPDAAANPPSDAGTHDGAFTGGGGADAGASGTAVTRDGGAATGGATSGMDAQLAGAGGAPGQRSGGAPGASGGESGGGRVATGDPGGCAIGGRAAGAVPGGGLACALLIALASGSIARARRRPGRGRTA